MGPAGTTASAAGGPTFLVTGVTPTLARWWTGTSSFFSSFTANASGEEPARGAPMPVPCNLNTIAMYASTNRRSTIDNPDTVTVTIYKNNVATLMVCSATSTTTPHEAVGVVCSSNPVSFSVGDTLGLQWTHSNTSSTLFTQYSAGLSCQ